MLRFVTFLLATVAFSALNGSASAQRADQPPNIVIIFTDDLGYGDVGVYGHPTISTPNIDRMAHEGMKFTQFYTGASVCTPSRAALLTGRLPIRSGMAGSRRVLFPNSANGLPVEEITIADALKERGYATAAVGKWHLGHLPEYLPTNQGFDLYFGIPYSNDMSPAQNPWSGASEFPATPLIRDLETIEEEPDQSRLTRRYTDVALEFIRENQDQPFFLYLAHTFPHVPLYASPPWLGSSSRGLYGDVVEEIDGSTGRIMQALQDMGLAENTLVFFTSDNGPWLVKHEEGGSAGLLREGKGTTWEGGMRVPAVAWWPGTVEPGVTTQSLATTMDLFSTSLSLAGAGIPDDRVIDGIDLSPVLIRNRASSRDEVMFYRGRDLWAIRKGPWKAHFRTQSAYVGDEPVDHDPPLLFNLEHDPEERFNLNEAHPEVVAELQAAAEAHLTSFDPPPSLLEARIGD